MNGPKLTGIDSIYIPVKNREQSMAWFIRHFGLEVEGDHLKIGSQLEFFFLETVDETTTNFTTKDWVQGETRFEMPAFCFRAADIIRLFGELKEAGVRVGELIRHGWFSEFDFYDPDNNKFKVWEPNN